MPFPSRHVAATAIEFHGIVGSGEGMRELCRLIARVGRTDVTALITGESGTGKVLVARALHATSRRTARPLVAVNCSALPSELVESELFGHVRGAFTGALRDRPGLFEVADGSTLLLDEVGDLAVAAQAKVLRALETGEIMPVGASRATSVNVRVIAATNRPLDQMVADGRFREDLLYRLKVITIALPPLRDRPDDIATLARRFVRSFAVQHGLLVSDIDERALQALQRWSWPGNVRELRNVVQRIYLMAEGHEIGDEWLQFEAPKSAAGDGATITVRVGTPLADVERTLILATLQRFGNHKEKTAAALGVSLKTLYNRLKEYAQESASPTDEAAASK